MHRITVINVKGGCGKTTIATNLASAYACNQRETALIDYDPQGSSTFWLKQRPEEASPINGIAAHSTGKHEFRSWKLQLPTNTERVIVDTPAGLKGLDLIDQLSGTHTIVIPVLPSSIDTHATANFIRDLYLIAKVQPKKVRLCIICNRVKPNTLAFLALEKFLDAMDIRVIARLRETQNYIRAAELGLGIHELGSRTHDEDIGTWKSIIDELDRGYQSYRLNLISNNHL